MNEIVSSKKSLLTSDHISSLAFINCTGPPVNNFKPLPYIKTCLVSGKRSAIGENCPKRLKVIKHINPFGHAWKNENEIKQK